MTHHSQKIEPRQNFKVEHCAQAELSLGDSTLRVTPFDVAKRDITIIVNSNSLITGAMEPRRVHSLTLSLFDKTFTLYNLMLTRSDDWPSQQHMKYTLTCGQEDRDAEAALWSIGYLVRKGSKYVNQAVPSDALPKVPARGVYTEEARQERLAFVREQTQAPLTGVANTSLDPKALVSNIEALIGSVEIPVGVAGPLLINGEHAHGMYYAPMATTEGALLASVTRGATAISRSGGVNCRVLSQRMLRVPVFTLSDLDSAFFFADWIQRHFDEISQQTKRYSNYADLQSLDCHVLGRSVYVRFSYMTGDASGQNMTTTCTWQACQWIMSEMERFEEVKFENFLVESNLSNDKKVTYESFLKGRGTRVLAECTLTREICEQVLKVTPKQLYAAFNSFIGGSLASGMVGININIANVIAAIFTATGQDIACVHESSIGQLHMDLIDEDTLYATMMLPSLVVGSVGGGTNLPQQRECLEMINSAGANNSRRLAEIIGGFCLALDLSTLSAIASDQFARAHEKLGRNRPVNWLKQKDLDIEFFNKVLAKHLEQANTKVSSIQYQENVETGSSIITELTSHKINKLVGLFPYKLKLDETAEPLDVMLKVKPLDDEVILMLNSMASMCDPRLAQAYNKFKDQLGFKDCHTRELALMSLTDERFTSIAPKVYGTLADPERELYAIVEERLTNMELMDSADDTSKWTPQHIKAAISGIAGFHSIWYDNEEKIKSATFVSHAPNKASMMEKMQLWELLGAHVREEYPQLFSEQDMILHRQRVYDIENWYTEIENMPKTIIHNDFNPRNIAFRVENGKPKLCAYDWELATVHLPQHDLAELLGFTLFDSVSEEQILEYLEWHRTELERFSGKHIDADEWRRGYHLCIYDLLMNRIMMYGMAHTFRHYKFIERVAKTMRHLAYVERHHHEAQEAVL